MSASPAPTDANRKGSPKSGGGIQKVEKKISGSISRADSRSSNKTPERTELKENKLNQPSSDDKETKGKTMLKAFGAGLMKKF
jgi:hypothetical protein